MYGDTRFDVTAPEYLPYSRSIPVTTNLSLVFDLAPRPLGTYRLTIRPNAVCPHELTEAAGTRVYTAVVEDSVPYGPGSEQLKVTLSGADFRADYGMQNSFSGAFDDENGTVRFILPDHNASIIRVPAVVEQLTKSTALVIAGEARLSGTLNGVIYIVPLVTDRGFQYPDYQNPIASCRSSAHQFVLSR